MVASSSSLKSVICEEEAKRLFVFQFVKSNAEAKALTKSLCWLYLWDRSGMLIKNTEIVSGFGSFHFWILSLGVGDC